MLKLSYKILLAVCVIFAAPACDKAPPSDNKAVENAASGAPEKFVLKKDTLITQLVIPAELIPNQQVDLYAKVTGFVKDLNVDIGSKVKKGDVLITLEAPELASQMAAAQSRLKAQEATHTASLANYNRLVETSKTPGTISPNDLEQAEAKKNADLANLEAARSSFREVSAIQNYLTIRAPFDGTITARNVNVGAYVGPSGKGSEFPALTLQQQSKLRLVLSVPESYSNYLRLGDRIVFKVRAMPSQQFETKLTRLSGALDTRLRSQRAEADIDNSEGKFLAGTVAEVITKFQSSPESFVVPKSAVVSSAEALYVVRVANGKAQRVNVRRGLENGQAVEVFGELSVGDQILKKATDEIRDGQPIQ